MAEDQVEEIKVKAPKLLNAAEMKKLAKAHNKRMGKDFGHWKDCITSSIVDTISCLQVCNHT